MDSIKFESEIIKIKSDIFLKARGSETNYNTYLTHPFNVTYFQIFLHEIDTSHLQLFILLKSSLNNQESSGGHF